VVNSTTQLGNPAKQGNPANKTNCSETLPKPMENSMWYEIVHRVNWYTTDRYTVWLKTKDDVWPLLDHLEINECLIHEYNGEQNDG
jgi:hypothetical protein